MQFLLNVIIILKVHIITFMIFLLFINIVYLSILIIIIVKTNIK